MTRNSYISMVITNMVENSKGEVVLETAYLLAVAAADFLESKGVAPWQERLRFDLQAQELQKRQAETAKGPEVLPDPAATGSN